MKLAFSRSSRLAAVLLVLSLGGTKVKAAPIQFSVDPGGSNHVTFTSKAPLETFDGKTKQVHGWFIFDPEHPADSLKGEIVVDMATLSTGLDQRDAHMRKNHLETDKYPTSSFVPQKIVSVPFANMPGGTSETFRVAGDFTLHGVTKPIEPEVTVTWHPKTGVMDVIAHFPVALADYKIPRPQFLMMRLGEVQQVEVKFSAKRQK